MCKNYHCGTRTQALPSVTEVKPDNLEETIAPSAAKVILGAKNIRDLIIVAICVRGSVACVFTTIVGRAAGDMIRAWATYRWQVVPPPSEIMATEWLQMYETIHGGTEFPCICPCPRDSKKYNDIVHYDPERAPPPPPPARPSYIQPQRYQLHPPSSSSDPDMDDECGAEVTDLRPGMITRLPLAYPPRCVSVIRIEDDQPLTFGVRRAQDHLPASGRGLAVWRGHGLDKSWVNEELECLSWVFSGSWVVRL